jgi:hypothetical protein
MTYSNGSKPETRLIRGEVVAEIEFDADGRPGRWRRMTISVPVSANGGITTAVTLDIELPDGDAYSPAPETWAGVVSRMGGAIPGGDDES